jgi:glutamate-1-semialdehyde 2,1-aminomutase
MNERWKTSEQLLERARQSLAGGVSSPFRALAPVPLYFKSGSGSHLVDEDDNQYIDYALAWGPAILGHCHWRMVAALEEAARKPVIYGAQHRLEIDVAERIQAAVPCAERVAFTSSGSEAVQSALRLARAHTGRNLVLKFEGHYHGWIDSILVSHHPSLEQTGSYEHPTPVPESRGQVANAADNLIVLPWNDIDLVRRAFSERGREIAAVIMEPLLANSGGIVPADGFLETMREITREHGSVLIFDEIITGFRMALSGGQGYYGITPDLATFGKAVAGGPPLSVIAGQRDIMELPHGGGVSFGGTFNGNPLSLAGARATLSVLAENHGQPLVDANHRGEALMAGIRQHARKHDVDLLVSGFGAAFSVHFTKRKKLRHYRDVLDDDRDKLRAFLLAMMGEGVNMVPDGRFYTSVVHTDEDIKETLGAVDRVLTRM